MCFLLARLGRKGPDIKKEFSYLEVAAIREREIWEFNCGRLGKRE